MVPVLVIGPSELSSVVSNTMVWPLMFPDGFVKYMPQEMFFWDVNGLLAQKIAKFFEAKRENS